MKKEDVETLLSPDGQPLDLGPIETWLEEIANAEELPDLAIGMCTLRFEEAAPALRAALARAGDGEKLSDQDAGLLFYGVHILGGARDTVSFQPLLRLLRRPIEELDDLLGDAITESLPKIVAGVFDGDESALFAAVLEPDIDEFVRVALLSAATFLTWDGRIDMAAMRAFLVQFETDRTAEREEYDWCGWQAAVATLGLRDLAPRVRAVFDAGLISDELMRFDDFEEDLRVAEENPKDINRFHLQGLGYIDDVIEALEWTRALGPADDGGDVSVDTLVEHMARQPAHNPMRDVGRNDPCPCGSGKKAKKCCIAT